MAKKKSKTSALEELLQTALGSAWCIVDIDNKFTFEDMNYVIDESVKQYVVLNKPKKISDIYDIWNDWTNEASMSTIFCVDTSDEIRFFDENLVEVNTDSIKIGK
jgi:hypothetical protein